MVEKIYEKEEEIHKEFQSELGEMLQGNLDLKTEDPISTMKNIKKFYKGQEKVINASTRMVSEAKYISIHGEGLKI